MNEFPISRAKVTPPPVREETLARERLLGWLDAAVRRRVVYVIAEAGYGKTTLLADFSHRTRVRCLWFKLDESDRDCLTFLHYLIAAGRESLPDFARETSALLSEAGAAKSIKEAAIQSFAAELEQLSDRPTAFIFDDYHLVDGDPDVARIVQRMIRALPERMCLIFLSRRRPDLRVARLQSLDEVREIGREDLRFTHDETDRLFSEAYKQPLETDVLDEVEARTEGWAASLQLLRSGLRGRNPAEVRAFVRRMAGSEGSLYDYLAEEVVGELPEPLRRFLFRTSVLDRVTPELARAALSSDSDPGPTLHEVRALIQQNEAIGLLSRRGESSRWSHRYHPLIREYLLGRLAEELTADEIRDLHRSIAREAETASWAVAAHHWLEAGEQSEVVATVERQISSIASSGQYSLAADFLTRAGVASPSEIAGIVQARIDLYAGRVDKATAYVERALIKPGTRSAAALQLLMSMAHSMGNVDLAARVARMLLALPSLDEWQAPIARAVIAIREISLDGRLERALSALDEAALVHERQHRWHLAAVSRLNLADLRRIAGDYVASVKDARAAIDHFRRSGGDALELGSAYSVLGASLGSLDLVEEASDAFREAQARTQAPIYQLETALLRAEFLADLGSLDEARALLKRAVEQASAQPTLSELALMATIGAGIAAKTYSFELATSLLGRWDGGHATNEVAGRAHRELSEARLAFLTGDEKGEGCAAESLSRAGRQGAYHIAWRAALARGAFPAFADHLPAAIDEAGRSAPGTLRSEAEILCGALHQLDPLPEALARAIDARPAAWLPHLRYRLQDPSPSIRRTSAILLSRFGEWSDVQRLRAFARTHPTRDLGKLAKTLAVRTAPKVYIDDLGRTTLHIGDRVMEATSMRRKVAALVTYLLTRPGYTATREQVLEALWPDAPPAVGTNSLHQTIYFLRRELELEYVEELSPGYVRLEGELVWLDPSLIDSASRRFNAELSALRTRIGPEVRSALGLYRGRFAPEFEYEDWAIDTRESLHAAYLELVGRALRYFAANGNWLEGAEVARLALAVDPSAEGIERNLIALYQSAGSHAAAAEQYGHFAAGQRADYGVEPPSIEAIVATPDSSDSDQS